MYKEYEESPAYAKIQGPSHCLFIKKLSVYLGREVCATEYAPDDEVYSISKSNKISRKHCHIFWDGKRRGWYAKNLSKNHIYINKSIVKNTHDPVIISPLSSIQIDENKFYFFQAREEDNKFEKICMEEKDSEKLGEKDHAESEELKENDKDIRMKEDESKEIILILDESIQNADENVQMNHNVQISEEQIPMECESTQTGNQNNKTEDNLQIGEDINNAKNLPVCEINLCDDSINKFDENIQMTDNIAISEEEPNKENNVLK